MKLEIKLFEHYGTLEIEGNISDIGDTVAFMNKMEELVATRKKFIVLDFSQSHFIASTIISSLINFAKKIEKQGSKPFMIVAPEKPAHDLFQMVSLQKIYTIYPTIENMIKHNRLEQ